jgi:hypothetical protein
MLAMRWKIAGDRELARELEDLAEIMKDVERAYTATK